jgi:phosphatidylserine/phosphatidylglycerophosphate/cardiolipin synthase-like enzyme
MESKNTTNGVSVKAYAGDAMALLAFDLDKKLLPDFAGFSVRVQYGTNKGYFIFNRLTFDTTVVTIPRKTTDNLVSTEFSPIQKFNWIYVPSTYHNLDKTYYGVYNFEVTPRYLENNTLLPLDPALTARIAVNIAPFTKGGLTLGFTRGFVASQAYVDHFGLNNAVRPNKKDLVFDLRQKSGPKPNEKNKAIKDYTFEQQFEWMGWQARKRIYELLDEVVADDQLSLDVFAYDLDEPYICEQLLQLAAEGRVRIILDNASLHTGTDDSGTEAFEDKFEKLFKKQAQNKEDLFRGRFRRFSHSKVFIVKRNGSPEKVLAGSTNFSTNGLYINANHVIIFSNKNIAAAYEAVFGNSFGDEQMKSYSSSDTANKVFDFSKEKGIPVVSIRFSPHTKTFAEEEINEIAEQVNSAKSDVLFAVMNDTTGSGELLKQIREAHRRTDIFTYGIVDTTKEVTLYKPGQLTGVRVAGKGKGGVLPPPFKPENKIPGISVHHKFVVIDFKGKDPVVYCGSSNLAQAAESANGDNLIAIRDKEVVTAFAIEAMRLIDHFHFRNREQQKGMLYLQTNDWYQPHFDENDLRNLQRKLLAKD